MKKLLKLSTLLITAALIFTSCGPKNTEEDGLPGHWTSNPGFYDSWNKDGWTLNNNKVCYTCNDVSNITENKVATRTLGVIPDDVEGVHVKIKQQNFTDAECGIRLFVSDDTASYYELLFWKGSYTLIEQLSGQEKNILSKNGEYSNIWNDAINEEGQENDVLFYSDGKYLVLNVNGVEVKTIERKLESGKCRTLMSIPHGATTPINVNWNFVEFQTAK